jgi:hypothetical protein
MIGTDEEQTVTIDATGGTFDWIWEGQTAADIAWDATAEEFQAAAEALSNIGPGNILVWKPSALVFRYAFRGALGSANQDAATTDDTNLTGGAGTAVVATPVAGVAGTQGKYNKYASGNTDGSQVPKCILRYDCVSDADGVLTLGLDGTSEHGQTTRSIDAFFTGTFRCEDLVGLDANALSTGKMRLINGTIYHGRVTLP